MNKQVRVFVSQRYEKHIDRLLILSNVRNVQIVENVKN